MWPRWVYRTLIVIAVAMLLVANVALWVNLSFVNTSRFVDTTAGILRQEDMRHVIAEKSVDALLADRPAARQLAGNAAVNGVTTLLGTTAFQDALRTIAGQLQSMLITGERPTITIESRPAQAIALAVAAALPPDQAPTMQTGGGELTIELFSRRDIPSLAPYVSAVQWAGIVAGVVGLGLLVLLAWGSADWSLGLRRAGLAVMGAAVVSALVIVVLLLVVLAQMPDASARTIVSGVYGAFASQLLVQDAIVFIMGAAVWAVGRLLRPAPARATA